jgi:hypothetical protein
MKERISHILYFERAVVNGFRHSIICGEWNLMSFTTCEYSIKGKHICATSKSI